MLHSVSDEVCDSCCPNNTIRPDELKSLVVALRDKGYVFRKFSDAALNGDARTVCLTFDDGMVDNYHELFPIVREFSLPVTCFVTNRGNPDFPREEWSVEDPIPPFAEFLTADMIREMDESGLVEFGGHTAGHKTLTKISDEEVRKEIYMNKEWLETVLKHEIMSFAYPRGGENDYIVSVVRSVGYKFAASMKKKMRAVKVDPYRIHRQIIPRGMETWKSVLLATRGRWKI